jgi:CspA family cold shock protein
MYVMDERDSNKPIVAEDAVSVEGTVKTFDRGRRYGFIAQDGTSKEVFLHQEAILGEGDDRILIAGDRVSFKVTEGPKGPRAASVRRL